MKIDVKKIGAPPALSAVFPTERPFGQQDDPVLDSALLSPAEKTALLEFRRRQASEGPAPDRFALGDILVANGHITRAQLDRALLRQVSTRRRLGEELIVAGAATKGQVERGLLLQKGLLRYALGLGLGLASLATTAPSAEAAQKHSMIQVSIMVIATAKLQVAYQALQLRISTADIARGYVDAPHAARFSVLTNSHAGYFVDFHPLTTLFDSVDIAGLSSAGCQLGADGGSVVLRGPQAPDLTHELSFRFMLSRDAQPGLYPWPLQLSVRAI